MAQREGIDRLEFSGTWEWMPGVDEYVIRREITNFFLDERDTPVAVRVTQMNMIQGGIAEYSAIADLEDRPALEEISDEGDLGLEFRER